MKESLCGGPVCIVVFLFALVLGQWEVDAALGTTRSTTGSTEKTLAQLKAKNEKLMEKVRKLSAEKAQKDSPARTEGTIPPPFQAESSQKVRLEFSQLDLNVTGLDYLLTVRRVSDGTAIMSFGSGTTFSRAGGKRVYPPSPSSGGPLVPSVSRGSDSHWGPYTETQWSIPLGTTRKSDGAAQVYNISVFTYDNLPDVVAFSQWWPNGADGFSDGDINRVASSFPSFRIPRNGEEGFVGNHRNEGIGFTHFAGYMGGDAAQYGTWDQAGSAGLAGGTTAGIIGFHRKDKGATLVVSPLSEFMSASLAVEADRSELNWGVMGNASSIPSGFRSFWVAVAVAGGMNEGVMRWGEVVRSAYGRMDQETNHARDLTLSYLGYSTDNGAYYYYWTDTWDNYQDLIVQGIQPYAQEMGIPYQYLQIDSWWYYRQNDTDKAFVPLSGVTNWTARPDIFPGGRQAVYQATGWPMMAHNRYWGTDNVYAANPLVPIGPTRYQGEHFQFQWGRDNAGLPITLDFWEYLFSINADWGLAVYEQDWLSLAQAAMPQLSNDVTFGRQWLSAMGTAAEKYNLTIQYCMSFPRHVMMALELPAVSQARASNDYQPGSLNVDYYQWEVGASSLWMSAIGVSPGKDSYWTMPTPQYTPHYTPHQHINTSETRNRLESVVSSMLNGPVQISDRIGYSDVNLIMKACNAEGLLLRPDVAAGPIDDCFTNRAFFPAGGNSTNGGVAPCPSGAEVHSTYSSLTITWEDLAGNPRSAVSRYSYILSANNPGVYGVNMLRSEDLPYKALEFGNFQTHEQVWLAWEHNNSHVLRTFSASQPLQLNPSDEYSFEYFTFVPVHPISVLNATTNPNGGWVLQGEVSKWISVSRQRFGPTLHFHKDGSVEVGIMGVPTESVTVSFIHWPSLRQVSGACAVGMQGTATVTVSQDGILGCLF